MLLLLFFFIKIDSRYQWSRGRKKLSYSKTKTLMVIFRAAVDRKTLPQLLLWLFYYYIVADHIHYLDVSDSRQNVASACPVTMSTRLRSRSLDRYGGGDRSFAEQHGGRDFSSAGLGDSSGRSIRTTSSAVDGWTSDNDITDNAWRRTIQTSSSSANQGKFIYHFALCHLALKTVVTCKTRLPQLEVAT